MQFHISCLYQSIEIDCEQRTTHDFTFTATLKNHIDFVIQICTADRCFEKTNPNPSKMNMPRRERSRSGESYVSITTKTMNTANITAITMYFKYLKTESNYFTKICKNILLQVPLLNIVQRIKQLFPKMS